MHIKLVAGGLCVFALSACASTSGLEQEIATIDARVTDVEKQITAGTSAIGGPGKDVRAQISYRPLISWANAFSARPADQSTIRFRQTARGGDLYNEAHECKLDWSGWHKHDGKRAWIDEATSTKVDLEVGSFAITPTNSGLDLATKLVIDGKTQVAANYRPACLPSVGGNIGVTAKAQPSALMQVQVGPGPNGSPHYRLAVVSPNSVGLEMRADFNWFKIGWTIPFNGIARELASGDIDLMLAKEGTILLPDGQTKTYRVSTVDPSVATSTNGLSFQSDLQLEITAATQ